MKITKFVHSCLLVEHEGKTVLFDPGNYSYDEKVFDYTQLETLDYLIITHEHQDHFYLPFVKEIIGALSPVKVVAPESVVGQLKVEGITATSKGDEIVSIECADHEKLLNFPIPENLSVSVFDTLTHPGDSLSFHQSKRVLALPIQAPWGSMVASCEKAVAVRPEIVIPIHDWHWNDRARDGLYKMAKNYFEQKNIRFVEPEIGQSIEI